MLFPSFEKTVVGKGMGKALQDCYRIALIPASYKLRFFIVLKLKKGCAAGLVMDGLESYH